MGRIERKKKREKPCCCYQAVRGSYVLSTMKKGMLTMKKGKADKKGKKQKNKEKKGLEENSGT